MQSDIDRVKRARGRGIAAMTTSNNMNITNTPSASTSFTESAPHPVAAVLGMSRNPVAYIAPNASSVIEGHISSDSDSDGASVSEYITPHVASSLKEGSPLHVPHLYWRCLASANINEFPMTFEALIDHGSSAVLISEQYVSLLGLRRRRLREPYSAELAMDNNGCTDIQFSKYVKLQLHDPSSFWSSKSIRAIIVPGLCAPMILGLPFFVHNDIIVDAAARTVIDKKCGFDLLHPTAPPLATRRKRTLKEFHQQLQADQKLMVAELEMVCHDCLLHMKSKFEQVAHVNPIAAIRCRIEILGAQEELQKLGVAIKIEFKDVFSEIPHIDDLPSDVYCRIKLKDASRSIHTRTYSTPRKYHEAWAILIKQHLDAGRI